MYDINTYVEDITLTYEQINYLLEVLAQHIGITQITGAPFSMDRLTIHNAVSKMLDDKKMLIEKHHEEDNKPKYEHRWAIKTCNDEVMQEYDSLEDAFEYYTSCYKIDWIEGGFNEGEYSIFDNELQVELTNEAPTFSVEYNWDVNVNVECGGTSIYTEDTPDEVMDTIREEFYRCNDYGTYEYQNDGICYGHVMDALESAEEERRNANAEEERA